MTREGWSVWFLFLLCTGQAGAGTEVVLDDGYHTGGLTNPDGSRNPGRWVPVPTRARFVGLAEPDVASRLSPPGAWLVFEATGAWKKQIIRRPWGVRPSEPVVALAHGPYSNNVVLREFSGRYDPDK